jgi:hypothetical protein
VGVLGMNRSARYLDRRRARTTAPPDTPTSSATISGGTQSEPPVAADGAVINGAGASPLGDGAPLDIDADPSAGRSPWARPASDAPGDGWSVGLVPSVVSVDDVLDTGRATDIVVLALCEVVVTVGCVTRNDAVALGPGPPPAATPRG